jgi:hypothetical protein
VTTRQITPASLAHVNGYPVIAYHLVGQRHRLVDMTPSDAVRAIVLVDRGDTYEPFVTWEVDVNGPSAYWGHYFQNLSDAKVDFARRVEAADPTI